MAKSAAKKSAPLEDLVEFFPETDVPQGSDDWLKLRLGMPTSSRFSAVLAQGRDGGESLTRDDYMKRLAGEILTGIVAEEFINDDMRRGKRMEPMALEWYEQAHLVDLERVGFVRRTVYPSLGDPFVTGCSPDAYLPKQRKIIEVKTLRPSKLIDVVERGAGGFPAKHRDQCQGSMWVADAETCDLILFYEGWRSPPKFTVERDEKYIALLREQVERFCYELKMRVKEIKARGKGW